MKWTMSRDGEKRVNVQAAWRLDRNALAGLLLASIGGSGLVYADDGQGIALDDGKKGKQARLPRAEVERRVREQLGKNADARFWWRDSYEDYPGDPTQDECLAWALEQVARL